MNKIKNTLTKKNIPTAYRYIINTVLFALFLILIAALVSGHAISYSNSKVMMLIAINVILTVSLNIATGYLGQLPLGHAGFMAVGAYTSALFMKAVTSLPPQVMFPFGLIFGGIVAAIFGLIIGIPALRLKGDYLAIITLGFAEIIRVIILNIDSVLGFKFTYGAASLKNIPTTTTVFNAFLWVGIICFIIHTLMKSRQGRAILSIRDNEIASESCGISTTFYKTLGFCVSAFFAGIAGGLYAGYIGLLSPGSFGFMKSIEILVMVVLGGMGSMLGSIISATVLTALPELLRAFSQYRMVVYALVLIAMMIFRPTGLMGSYDFSMGKSIERLRSGFRTRHKTSEKEDKV